MHDDREAQAEPMSDGPDAKSDGPDEAGSRRLAHSVYRRLEDMIFSGQLKGGSVLTERKLAEALDVSRTPLRDALLMLEGEGLLKRRSPRYLEVHQMTVPEFMQILNIRRLLEPEAARLCVGRVDAGLFAHLHKRLATLLSEDSTASELRSGESAEIDKTVHEAIADGSGNPLMAGMIRDLRRRTRIFDLGRMPERAKAVYQEHLDIVVAVEIGDPHAASDAMTRHIDNVKTAVLRHITSI
jgi:DNA-binding GntR family transcriptional regulator